MRTLKLTRKQSLFLDSYAGKRSITTYPSNLISSVFKAFFEILFFIGLPVLACLKGEWGLGLYFLINVAILKIVFAMKIAGDLYHVKFDTDFIPWKGNKEAVHKRVQLTDLFYYKEAFWFYKDGYIGQYAKGSLDLLTQVQTFICRKADPDGSHADAAEEYLQTKTNSVHNETLELKIIMKSLAK